MVKFGCKKCRKEVKPKNEKLTCCGITEDVPHSNRCHKCGGLPLGSGAGRFLGQECCCNMLGEYDDETFY